jgi:hypothetical protein
MSVNSRLASSQLSMKKLYVSKNFAFIAGVSLTPVINFFFSIFCKNLKRPESVTLKKSLKSNISCQDPFMLNIFGKILQAMKKDLLFLKMLKTLPICQPRITLGLNVWLVAKKTI